MVAPLNWGLGHASRSIPIVSKLLQNQKEVILASDGSSLNLLNKEFPHLDSIELPSYNIKYQSGSMVLNILSQLPKIYLAYRKEKKRIQKIVEEYDIDVIISDNRYGCLSPRCKNIIVCHQVQIQSSARLLKKIATRINLSYLNKFDQCWIPDTENNIFAGELSKPTGLDNYQYIGPLSRLKHRDFKTTYDLIVIISGPEPDRTKFETKIMEQLRESNIKAAVVRGTNKKRRDNRIYRNIDIYNLLSGFDLNRLISKSKYILSRSGYSTIMDLYKLQKKAILIPTPGQTEQEYLAQYLRKEAIFYSCSEKSLDLYEAMQEVEDYPGFSDIVVEEPDLISEIQMLFN